MNPRRQWLTRVLVFVALAGAHRVSTAVAPPTAQTALSDTVLVFDTPIAIGEPSRSATCALLAAAVPPSRAACQARLVRRHLKRQS